jgi:hypothetical protein
MREQDGVRSPDLPSAAGLGRIGFMSTAFSFFLRLFLCFVAARLLLHAVGVGGRGYLVGLTILFLVNVYWFSYLVFRDRTAPEIEAYRKPPGSQVAAASERDEPSEPPAPPGA